MYMERPKGGIKLKLKRGAKGRRQMKILMHLNEVITCICDKINMEKNGK